MIRSELNTLIEEHREYCKCVIQYQRHFSNRPSARVMRKEEEHIIVKSAKLANTRTY